MSDFASFGDLTEAQYSRRLFDKLQTGQLMDLLQPKAQCRLGDWIGENYLENKKEFGIMFRLSLNRIRNVALHCVCSMNMEEDEPKIYVKHAIPGFDDHTPPEACIRDRMEFNFNDMEPRI